MVCSPPDTGRMPDGIIDPAIHPVRPVAELAVAASSVLRHEGGERVATLLLIEEFNAVRPLSPAEVEAPWPLVVLRGAVPVVSGNHQASIDAENEYATGSLWTSKWRIFERATAVPTEVMTVVIRDALGVAHPADPVAAESPLLSLDLRIVTRLDPSLESDAMDPGRGRPGV